MALAPVRSNNFFEARSDDADHAVREIEQRLERLRAEEEQRVDRFERKMLDDSGRRIKDFERRLEHEWIALRQLHEESLKTVEQRTIDVAASCLSVVQEALGVLRAREPESQAPRIEPLPSRPRAVTAVLVGALLTLTAFSAYTAWRLDRDLRAVSARATASEARLAEMRQFVETQTRDTGDATRRLTAEALSAASAAERLASVLAAADVRVHPLRGQAAAAAASGQVFHSPTRGIALSASHVARLPGNQTYQMWMTTSRGPVSLGFVEPDAQGRVGGAFESAPELPGNVIGFMITIEPTGGSERPSGAIALTS